MKYSIIPAFMKIVCNS